MSPLKCTIQIIFVTVLLLQSVVANYSAEQAIRDRIEADNKAVVAHRKKVGEVRLDRMARNRFLNPEEELKFSAKADAPEGSYVLWYDRPASYWTEALPLGNGRLGAMVFGGIKKELIQLNEDTLWTGEPIKRVNPEATQYLDQARELLFEGEYENGQKLIHEKIMGKRLAPGLHTYQMSCDVLPTKQAQSPSTCHRYASEMQLSLPTRTGELS
jgi:hypothetical protein